MTLAPQGQSSSPALQASRQVNNNMSFEEASVANHIYQGNGLICQRAMCQSMTGCDSALSCQNNPDYSRIVQFCGPISTGGKSMDGAWWSLQQSGSRQQLLGATEKQVGMSPLPNPYNVAGMY